MARPLIGVTVDRVLAFPDRYESPSAYAKAVELAGGLPVMLPYHSDLSIIPDYVDRLDGILFSGGDDMDPSVYGESWHPKAQATDPARTRFELALMAEVERRRLPTLGVCMGSQLMNVYRGGSLVQFLPDQPREGALEHRKLDVPVRLHPVRLEPDSLLGRAIGKIELTVNSLHKQAVNKLGRGLRIVATAPDGVVEGIEDPTMPLFLAVQWHPEKMTDRPEHLAPFRLLVEKSRTS